jgi:hypothetical protein
VGAMLPAFQNKIVCQQPIFQISKPARLPLPFSKALSATLKHLWSYMSKGFELAGFKKLSANSKASSAKQLRTY